MEGLSIILADSALEPVPKELSNHPVIRKYRTLYKKHSDNILLDKSFHSPCMKLLPDNEKRGRPDIVHLSLISLTSSPLYLEKKLKVYVHTVTNSVIDINFGVRLPKSYSRFRKMDFCFLTGLDLYLVLSIHAHLVCEYSRRSCLLYCTIGSA